MESRVCSLWFRVSGAGFRFEGEQVVGFRFEGLGLRVSKLLQRRCSAGEDSCVLSLPLPYLLKGEVLPLSPSPFLFDFVFRDDVAALLQRC